MLEGNDIKEGDLNAVHSQVLMHMCNMPKLRGRAEYCLESTLLFWYCFGEENSLSLTEFWGKLGEFALAHN